MDGELMDVAGQRLEVRQLGPSPAEAPTLVFLHEGLGCAGLWRDFPGQLAAATGCGALVYSRRGYGRSEPVELPRPLSYMEDEGQLALPALLAVCAVREAILIGHSDGGSIAIVYAGTHQAGVKLAAVALEAPHVFCEDVSVTSIAAAAEAYQHGDLRERLRRHHGDNVDCAFWGWNRAWLDPRFSDWNIQRFLPHITVPLLVIQGASDEYGTLRQVEAIEAGVAGPVERLVLPGCGHSPHRERPAETLQALTRFIRRALGHPSES